MSAKALYTPDILAKAMVLAQHAWSADAAFHGAARSRSCGSAIELSLETDDLGRIRSVGVRPHACAIGQAAAAIFVDSAVGRDRDEIGRARAELGEWLGRGEGALPDWPEIDLLSPALSYPARHAAILLAWDAALDALPQPAGS